MKITKIPMFHFLQSLGHKIGAGLGSILIAAGGLIGGGHTATPVVQSAPQLTQTTTTTTSTGENLTNLPSASPSQNRPSFLSTVVNHVVPATSEKSQETLPAKDQCPNLDGIQTLVPNTMFFSEKYGGCFTQAQIDAFRDAENKISNAAQAAADREAKKKDILAKIDMYNKELVEIDYGYFEAKKDDYGKVIDIYTPQNPIPHELKLMMASAPWSVTGGGNASVLPKSSQLTSYVKEKINLIILDLQAQYRQL